MQPLVPAGRGVLIQSSYIVRVRVGSVEALEARGGNGDAVVY